MRQATSASPDRRARRSLAVGALALLLGATTARAQNMDVPAGVQIPLLFKILTFDRNFAARMGDVVVIGILYQQRYRPSVVARQEVEAALRDAGAMGDRTVNWVVFEESETPDLAAILRRHGVDVLYVTPLRGVGIDQIFRAARATQVMTFTGVPPYVEEGLSVGIGLRQERAMILVNLNAARAEGADYTAQLLRVAQVVGGQR